MSEKSDKQDLDLSAVSSGKVSSVPAKTAKEFLAKHLQNHMKKLFASIDDSFFEYSEKAVDNQQRSDYFDAMREIRKEQKTVLQLFFKKLEKRYDDTMAGIVVSADNDSSSGEDFSYSTLSLVDDNDLEESLAITNMVEKSYGMYREDLLALAKRFAHIINKNDVEITAENCPVSPNHICRAFEEAADKFSIGLEMKLIVFKLFDKYVNSELLNMYREINKMFIDAGVLPTIKLSGPVKSQEQEVRERPAEQQPAAPQSAAPAAAPPSDSADVSFGALKEMLSMHRGQAPGEAASGVGAAVGGVPAGGYYVTNDVLAELTQLQGNFMGVAAQEMQGASVEEIKNNLLDALGKKSGDGTEKGLDNDESDVIDIVSMMFEFILEDKTLSDRVRAEIARLQIPVIKVAILDKKFFDQQSHPARLLLNELAYAGGSQELGDEDAIFLKVEYVVNRVLAEFQTNVDIFTELLEEFKQFVDTELQGNKVSEKRLVQIKQRVSDEIEKRIKEYKIPKLVYDFLGTRWKDVLTRVGMKTGCKGTAWTACVDVISDLIWSVQPKLMSSERQELTRMIPKIIKRVREGLKLISIDDKTTQEFLDQLGALHLNCLKGGNEMKAKKDPLDEIEASLKAELAGEDDDSGGNPFADDLPEGEFEYFATSDDFTMVQLTSEAKRSKNYKVVQEMEMGTWVEFKDKEKEKVKRGKLSWKCDFTGDFTFVDRRYKLVADISTMDLITRLDNETATIITDIPLLDKAINAVVSTMTKAMQSANNLVSSGSGTGA
ncbi:DUF1631 domain-containing protein [Kaarinaea lacus]